MAFITEIRGTLRSLIEHNESGSKKHAVNILGFIPKPKTSPITDVFEDGSRKFLTDAQEREMFNTTSFNLWAG